MSARLSAFVIWSLVAATAVFWALRFSVDPVPVPAHALVIGKTSSLRGDLSRLFGAAPIAAGAAEATPEASSRFRLVGIMAPKRADTANPYGLALIAVDGKPPRAFKVGSSLDDGLVLQSVSLRTAAIGPAQGERSVLLELPALPAPSTGVLPAPGMPGAVAPTPGAPALIGRLPPPLPASSTIGVPQPPVVAPQMPTAVPPPAAPPGLPPREGVQSQ